MRLLIVACVLVAAICNLASAKISINATHHKGKQLHKGKVHVRTKQDTPGFVGTRKVTQEKKILHIRTEPIPDDLTWDDDGMQVVDVHGMGKYDNFKACAENARDEAFKQLAPDEARAAISSTVAAWCQKELEEYAEAVLAQIGVAYRKDKVGTLDPKGFRIPTSGLMYRPFTGNTALDEVGLFDMHIDGVQDLDSIRYKQTIWYQQLEAYGMPVQDKFKIGAPIFPPIDWNRRFQVYNIWTCFSNCEIDEFVLYSEHGKQGTAKEFTEDQAFHQLDHGGPVDHDLNTRGVFYSTEKLSPNSAIVFDGMYGTMHGGFKTEDTAARASSGTPDKNRRNSIDFRLMLETEDSDAKPPETIYDDKFYTLDYLNAQIEEPVIPDIVEPLDHVGGEKSIN